MSESKDFPRFSTTWKDTEITELDTYISATGVDRNELIRRSTLAYVRVQTNKEKDIKKAYEKVGPLHDKAKR